MRNKKIEDYEDIDIIPEDAVNPKIEFTTDNEISELKDIQIFEVKQNDKE